MPNKQGPSTKIKVSQATIDKIKKMGMTAALKSAPGANAEMEEGLRRMYGARRLSEAKAKYAPKVSGGTNPVQSGKYLKPSNAKPKGPAPKKNSNNLGKAIAGGAAAAGLLIASRGKATGLATKLAPGLAKSGVGKALFGTGKAPVFKNPIVDKATAGVKAGAKQPKVPGTRKEYAAKLAQDKAAKEMTALVAKKKAAAAAAAKAAAKAPKTPAKAPSLSTKKKVVAGMGVGGGSVGLKGDSGKRK